MLPENRIINKPKGSITEKGFEGYSIDYVDLPWYDSEKRIQKLVTNKGINIGIRLDSDNVTGDFYKVMYWKLLMAKLSL